MLQPVTKHIFEDNPNYIPLYVYREMNKKGLDTTRIVKMINTMYPNWLDFQQVHEFGNWLLNQYLIDKHRISFDDLLNESVEPIKHRFMHLAGK